jgi:hypothetical protein
MSVSTALRHVSLRPLRPPKAKRRFGVVCEGITSFALMSQVTTPKEGVHAFQ